MVKAGQQLHQLRYLLLEAALTPDSAPAWRRLLVRVAEALLDGSTPPAAVPLLAALLQRGLARQGGEAAEGSGGQLAGSMSKQDEVGSAGFRFRVYVGAWLEPTAWSWFNGHPTPASSKGVRLSRIQLTHQTPLPCLLLRRAWCP